MLPRFRDFKVSYFQKWKKSIIFKARFGTTFQDHTFIFSSKMLHVMYMLIFQKKKKKKLILNFPIWGKKFTIKDTDWPQFKIFSDFVSTRGKVLPAPKWIRSRSRNLSQLHNNVLLPDSLFIFISDT